MGSWLGVELALPFGLYGLRTLAWNMYQPRLSLLVQLLRIEHPPAKYQKVLGGAVEIEAEPQKLKFFDRHKGGL